MDVGENDEGTLDPRIQIELENLNTATDGINRLESELDEAHTTFRILLNECTRRLNQKSKTVGSCVEKARPYYEALDVARLAQLECQRAAVQYQRANEIHQAAKETVALAEQRFLSKQDEWQFDNAWQEMLNHATMKVRDAETQKAESGREHQAKAMIFNAAEQRVQQFEQRLHRHIIKSRPYFEEKCLCNGQLAAQKDRVLTLQKQITAMKNAYAHSLKELERISEEIHCKRNRNKPIDGDNEIPCGPREPGVGAELTPIFSEAPTFTKDVDDIPVPKEDPSPLVMGTDDHSKCTVLEEPKASPSIRNVPPATPTRDPQVSSTVTPLPLLESLAQFKESESCVMLNLSFNSPYRSLQSPLRQAINITRGSEEPGRTDSDPSSVAKIAFEGDRETSELSNEVLLTHLMHNYESELDRCDMASIGSASVATSSSAVSEKDDSEVLAEEELEELREQIRVLSTHPSTAEPLQAYSIGSKHFSQPVSTSNSQSPSVCQTPVKTLASSMSLPSLLLASDSEIGNTYLRDSSANLSSLVTDMNDFGMCSTHVEK